MTENIFEQASRNRIRFAYKGLLTTEDLWSLRLEELDNIFKGLNATLKTETEESLLGPKEKVTSDVGLKVAIVRYIVGVKLAELAQKQLIREKKQKKEKLLEILSEKKDTDLRSKSIEELTKMLEDL